MPVTKHRVTKGNSPRVELPVRRAQTLTVISIYAALQDPENKVLHAKHSSASVKNKSTLIEYCFMQKAEEQAKVAFRNTFITWTTILQPEPLKKWAISCTRVERCPKGTSILWNRFAGQQFRGTNGLVGIWKLALWSPSLYWQSWAWMWSLHCQTWKKLISKAGRWSW